MTLFLAYLLAIDDGVLPHHRLVLGIPTHVEVDRIVADQPLRPQQLELHPLYELWGGSHVHHEVSTCPDGEEMK